MSEQNQVETGSHRELTPKQERAITALLSGMSVFDAAKAAGVAYSTLRRWLKEEPGFLAAYRSARRDCFETAVAKLQVAASQAAEALIGCLADPDPGHRIRAAVAVFRQALDGVEALEVAEKVEELEAAVEQIQQQDRNNPWR